VICKRFPLIAVQLTGKTVLYKITIQPVLVMKPGHMFVGYHVNPQGPMEFLETTMIGNGPPVLRDRPFPVTASATFRPSPPIGSSSPPSRRATMSTGQKCSQNSRRTLRDTRSSR